MKAKWAKPDGWKPAKTSVKEKTLAWLRENVSHRGDECLIGRFFRLANGYGILAIREKCITHIAICANLSMELRYQEMKRPIHAGMGIKAAQTKHLSWKTKIGNRRDSIRHGTSIRNTRGRRGILTDEQIVVIRN